MTVIIKCISWLINVTDNNDAWWKHESKLLKMSLKKAGFMQMVYSNSIIHTG